jgi:hypothetical protein
MPDSRITDIHNSKHDGSLEGHIVALVDIIEAYTKIEQEFLLQRTPATIKLLYESLGNLQSKLMDIQDNITPVVEVFFTQILKDMTIHSNLITGLDCPCYEGRSEINKLAIEILGDNNG